MDENGDGKVHIVVNDWEVKIPLWSVVLAAAILIALPWLVGMVFIARVAARGWGAL